MSCIFYFFNFSPGASIQMAAWNFLRNSSFLTDNRNFPCNVSPPPTKREFALPFKRAFAWLNRNHCRNHSNKTLVPSGILAHTDTQGRGKSSGIFNMKQGSIMELRVEYSTSVRSAGSENPQVFTSFLERLKHMLVASKPTHCHPLASPWTRRKLIGLCSYFGSIFHLRTRNCHQLAPLAAEPVTGQGWLRKGLWLN